MTQSAQSKKSQASQAMEARATEATAIKAQAKKVKRSQSLWSSCQSIPTRKGQVKWPKSQSEEPAESDEDVNFLALRPWLHCRATQATPLLAAFEVV